MEVRDAVEADAEALAGLGDAPADVMRNLVHDRTVRVATDGVAEGPVDPESPPDLQGFVSFDVRDTTVHVTQVAGDRRACERLLEEPIRFARGEGMEVELLVPASEADTRAAAEAVGFESRGTGPSFEGQRTVRYRQAPASDAGTSSPTHR
jgi:hypothetical protein